MKKRLGRGGKNYSRIRNSRARSYGVVRSLFLCVSYLGAAISADTPDTVLLLVWVSDVCDVCDVCDVLEACESCESLRTASKPKRLWWSLFKVPTNAVR